MSELKNLILSFCNTSSVSGIEDTASPTIFPSELFDKTECDELGNRYFFKNSNKKNVPLLLIDAHFDEVGLMVSEVLEDGFLKVSPIGSPDMRAIPAAPLIVYGREPIFAVAASTPPHLRSKDSGDLLTTFKDLLVDTGLSTERTNELVRVGDRIGYKKAYAELQNNKLYACGLDNKSTAAIAIHTIGNLKKDDLAYNICVLLSSKEESGCIGARLAAKRISPMAAIVLDVGFAAAPDIPSSRCIKMDGGVGISYSAALDRRLTESIIKTAKKCDLEVQVIVENPATGTNADYIQFHAGVPSALLSLPLSNMHTPVEVISMNDAYEMSRLINVIVTDPTLLGGDK